MFISSDTNVWLDFSYINSIKHPFLLDNKYYLSDITYHDEIKNKYSTSIKADCYYESIRKCVKESKLLITEVSADELKLAVSYEAKYHPPFIKKAISLQDSIALAIAKNRNWYLLTGDSGIREAAKIVGVECHGTIWIYDELLNHKILTLDEYLLAMKKLKQAVEKKERYLPLNELNKRIEKYRK